MSHTDSLPDFLLLDLVKRALDEDLGGTYDGYVVKMNASGSDIDYGTYPSQDLEDKWKYVSAVYITGAETPSYSTNLGVNYPPGVTLDVFRITAYDGIEMQCRIRDMTLFKNVDPSKSIELDGTFTGAVTFLN